MTQHTPMEQPIPPYSSTCYTHAWKILWKYFLELLLLLGVSIVLSMPTIVVQGLDAVENSDVARQILQNMDSFIFYYIGIFVFIYVLLVQWPLEYGLSFAFLRASREETPKVSDIAAVFPVYLQALLANILTAFIVILGIFLLIIPGIIFACRLAFVPYLVVDRQLDAVAAVRESWRLTRGHAMTIFVMGLLSILIAILGLALLIVGIFIAILWIRLAFASLYYTVAAGEGLVSAANQEH